MRRAALGCALLMALVMPVRAEDKVGVTEGIPRGAGETALAEPIKQATPPEYAFDIPEVLTAQLLWGVAHGVRLLARACAESGKHAAAEAWVDWQEREQPQIMAARRVLGRHYFDVEDLSPAVISGALGLKPALELSPKVLGPACDSLAQALSQPRYDLSRFQVKTLELLRRGDKPDRLEILK
jgi:hypothetical protein